MQRVKKTVYIVLFLSSLLFGIDKDDHTQQNTQALLQLNITNMQTFDFLGFEDEYNLTLEYCIGSSVCFFKSDSADESELETMFESMRQYGKVKLYKPYKMKIY